MLASAAHGLSTPAPQKLSAAVEIRDRERVEPPHVTILRRTQAWRLDPVASEENDDE